MALGNDSCCTTEMRMMAIKMTVETSVCSHLLRANVSHMLISSEYKSYCLLVYKQWRNFSSSNVRTATTLDFNSLLQSWHKQFHLGITEIRRITLCTQNKDIVPHYSTQQILHLLQHRFAITSFQNIIRMKMFHWKKVTWMQHYPMPVKRVESKTMCIEYSLK